MKKNIWVIKAGGELLVPGPVRKRILRDIGRWSRSHAVVFVHGGGPQIERELAENGVPNKFVAGRRVTSPLAMQHVERILSGQINKELAAELSKSGIPSLGLSCRDGNTITAKPIPKLGRAGHPVRVNTSLIKTLLRDNYVPVLSSVASDASGASVNINADDAASALAVALRASNLVFLTNIAGVFDQNKKRIPVLRTKAISSLIDRGTISGGMIPKVQSARSAIKKGVGEVDILNGKSGIRLDGGTRIKK